MVVFENVPVTLLAVSTVKVCPAFKLDTNVDATVKFMVPAKDAAPVTFTWLNPVPAAVPPTNPVMVPVASCVYVPVMASNPALPLSPTLIVAAPEVVFPTDNLPFTDPAPRIVPPVMLAPPAIPAREPSTVVVPAVCVKVLLAPFTVNV